jgi:hypothetical protein
MDALAECSSDLASGHGAVGPTDMQGCAGDGGDGYGSGSGEQG